MTVDSGAWLDQGLTDVFGRRARARHGDADRASSASSPTRTPRSSTRTTTPDVLSLARRGWRRPGRGAERVGSSPRRGAARRAATGLTQTFDLTSGNDDRIRAVVADDALADRLVTGDDRVLAAHEVVASLSLLALSSATGGCVGRRRPVQPRPGPAPAESAAEAQIPPVGAARRLRRPQRHGRRTGHRRRPGHRQPHDRRQPAQGGRPGVGERADPRRRPRPAPRAHAGRPARRSAPTRPTCRSTQGRVDGFRSMVEIRRRRHGTTPGGATPGHRAASSWPPRSTRSTLSSGAVAFDEPTRQDYLDGADARIDDPARPDHHRGADDRHAHRRATAPSRSPSTTASTTRSQVRVTLESDKLEFPDGRGHRPRAAPPARPDPGRRPGARPGPRAPFPLEVTITSPDGRDAGLRITSGQFNVRSTAVSGVGLVLSIAAGLFLLLWWGRHFRKHPARQAPDRRRSPVDPTRGVRGGTRIGGRRRRHRPANGNGSPPGAISYAPADRDSTAAHDHRGARMAGVRIVTDSACDLTAERGRRRSASRSCR